MDINIQLGSFRIKMTQTYTCTYTGNKNYLELFYSLLQGKKKIEETAVHRDIYMASQAPHGRRWRQFGQEQEALTDENTNT